MYGGAASKMGRAGHKRLHNSFPPPPPPHRRSTPSSAGSRLSLGGSARETPPAVEETFNLVSGSNSLAFSMMIRLAPDLVEEIKRVEAQGGTARMKFDPNPNNPNGNIIDVGGKEFRFTWSREPGDLCDIYEERQSGEVGNGLLVESGRAWRKLNVQRILDESTKNHVKMRSEEAERKLKSRKAIVLEPGNPSMKSQIKALAAVEATPRRNYNKKKESALKKRKLETLQVGVPPKSSHRSGLMSTSTTAKGRNSSPLPSPPDHFAASSSPRGALNISKSIDDAVLSQITGKQDTTAVTEKEIPTRTHNAMRNTPGGKGNNGSKPIDLQGMLISFLKDKPNGATLKGLEKAVSDTLPSSIKQIEPIIKKIAKYQAPGRYILKPAVDSESFKKTQTESGSGSSPKENRNQRPAREEFHDQTSVPRGGFEEKVPNDDLDEMVQIKSKVEEESNTSEKIDVQHTSPDIFGDKKGSDYNEGRAGSSGDNGSDTESESDSSDSGSDSGSHSRSKSKSPAGSGSGSSSDSESDASSSSKEGLEGSDEDVDIMTSDDEKEPKLKAETCDVKSPHGISLKNQVDEKQYGNESDTIEIEKDFPEEQEAKSAPGETKPFSPDYQQLQEHQNYKGSLFDETENVVKNSSRREKSDSSDRLSKGKHKKGSDVANIDERRKRLKTGNLTHESFSPSTDMQMFEKSRNLSPFEFTKDTYKDPNIRAGNIADRQGNLNVGFQRGNNHALPQTFQREVSNYQKQGDMVGMLMEGRQDSQSQLGTSPKGGNNRIDLDKSPGVDRRGISLQRELSDSELVGYRESTPDETCVAKQFERKESFKHTENNTNTSEDINSDINKVNPSLKATLDSGKPSSAFVSPGFPSNLESTSKMNVDNHFEDSTKSHSRVVQTHLQHLKADNAVVVSQNKLREMSSKFRNSVSGANQYIDLVGRSENNRRVPGHTSKQDTRGMVFHPLKESKGQTPNSCEEVVDGGNDPVFADKDNRDQKNRESSSEESTWSYLKYDKDEPELKGPISSYSQYREYVQEFQDKYDSYLSLHKFLEGYSNEFKKLAVECGDAKVRGDMDRYNAIREQAMESYRRCGARYHKGKKIFMLLHAELPSIKQRIRDFFEEYTKG